MPTDIIHNKILLNFYLEHDFLEIQFPSDPDYAQNILSDNFYKKGAIFSKWEYVFKELDLETFLILINYYNLDIYQLYPTRNFQTNTILYLNLFAFVKNSEIIKYLLDKGLDPYYNLKEGNINKILILEIFEHLDLTLLEDPIIYQLLGYLDDFLIFNNSTPLQKLGQRLLMLEKLEKKYYKDLLECHFYLNFNMFNYTQNAQNCFSEVLRKYLNVEIIGIGDIFKICLEWLINNREKNIDKYLKILRDLYQLDFTNFIKDEFQGDILKIRKFIELVEDDGEDEDKFTKMESYLIIYILAKMGCIDLDMYIESFYQNEDYQYVQYLPKFYLYENLEIEYAKYREKLLEAIDKNFNIVEFEKSLVEL